MKPVAGLRSRAILKPAVLPRSRQDHASGTTKTETARRRCTGSPRASGLALHAVHCLQGRGCGRRASGWKPPPLGCTGRLQAGLTNFFLLHGRIRSQLQPAKICPSCPSARRVPLLCDTLRCPSAFSSGHFTESQQSMQRLNSSRMQYACLIARRASRDGLMQDPTVSYPCPHGATAEIAAADVARLKPGCSVNEEVVQYGMKCDRLLSNSLALHCSA